MITKDALCEGIAGTVEIVCHGGRVQTQVSRFAGQRPLGFVAKVVPSPLLAQVVMIEVVVGGQARLTLHGNGRFAVYLRLVLVDTYHGPILFPTDGQQVWSAPIGSLIGKEHGPPLALLGVNECSLVYVAVIEKEFLLIGAEYVFRTEYGLIGWYSAIGGIDVVVFAYLVKATSLQSRLYTIFCYLTVFYSLEILVHTGYADIVDTIGDVCIVSVEEQTAIIETALQFALLPWSADVVGGKQITTFVECGEEHVECSVLVLKCRGPLSSAIAPLSVKQAECIATLYALQRIATIFPVDKVFRLHDSGTREDMHGGRYHIVCIAYAAYIGVGKIAKDNRVGEGTISSVGRGYACECLAWIVALGILLEPMVHWPRTCLGIIKEGVLTILGWLVLEGGKVLGRCEQYPADIAGIVGYLLEVGTEVLITCHTGMCLAPRGIVLLVCPVHFGYHNRGKVGNGLYILLPAS